MTISQHRQRHHHHKRRHVSYKVRADGGNLNISALLGGSGGGGEGMISRPSIREGSGAIPEETSVNIKEESQGPPPLSKPKEREVPDRPEDEEEEEGIPEGEDPSDLPAPPREPLEPEDLPSPPPRPATRELADDPDDPETGGVEMRELGSPDPDASLPPTEIRPPVTDPDASLPPTEIRPPASLAGGARDVLAPMRDIAEGRGAFSVRGFGGRGFPDFSSNPLSGFRGVARPPSLSGLDGVEMGQLRAGSFEPPTIARPSYFRSALPSETTSGGVFGRIGGALGRVSSGGGINPMRSLPTESYNFTAGRAINASGLDPSTSVGQLTKIAQGGGSAEELATGISTGAEAVAGGAEAAEAFAGADALAGLLLL